MLAESAGQSPTRELFVRYRGASVLFKVARGGRALERDPPGRFSRSPPAVAHLLRGQVLCLSAEGFRGAAQSGAQAKPRLPCLLRSCPRVSNPRSQDPPTMDAQ